MQRLGSDLARDRRPAQHRRHRAGCSADHDVLRRRGLQEHRVDDGVADEGREGEPHRQLVHVAVQEHEPEPAHDAGKGERRKRGELAARQRPPPRAGHQRVDFLLDETVDRGRRAGDERDADRREEHDARRRKPGVDRNMPMTAQKTINDTTRGFVSARKCLSRVSASARSVVESDAAVRLAYERIGRREIPSGNSGVA